MCLDPVVLLVMDGTDSQVALEVLECLFDLDEEEIEFPQPVGLGGGNMDRQDGNRKSCSSGCILI